MRSCLLNSRQLSGLISSSFFKKSCATFGRRLHLIAYCVLFATATSQANAQRLQAGVQANNVELIELIADPAINLNRVVAPAYVSSRARSATFNVNYNAASCESPVTPWPADAQAAFTHAANLWASILSSPVVIEIDACWRALGPGVLGSAGPGFVRDFAGTPEAGTWYPSALANALAGEDLFPGDSDITANFSSSFTNWYLETDGNPGLEEYDFVTVVMHEIGHGLGFVGLFTYANGFGAWGVNTGYPGIYDRFTENGNDQSLINTAIFPNPSIELGLELTSNNLRFDGPAVVAANGGLPAQIYAPFNYNPGSSYSHLGPDFDNTPSAMMTYSLSQGEVAHDPGPVGLGVLQDIGWQVASVANDSDNDDIDDEFDNCPQDPNPNQEDLDRDEVGDACDPDIDGDDIVNESDNCSEIANEDQADLDRDGSGDLCDTDIDGDDVDNDVDNCPEDPNAEQEDDDRDGIGNACDGDTSANDSDGDDIEDDLDNCPEDANPNQEDADRDNIGDVCEPGFRVTARYTATVTQSATVSVTSPARVTMTASATVRVTEEATVEAATQARATTAANAQARRVAVSKANRKARATARRKARRAAKGKARRISRR